MEFEKPNLKRNVPEESDVSEESDGDDCELRKRMKIQIEPCFLPNDVKLVVEDQHLHVNRNLLATASPVFAAWLKDEWQEHQQADTTLRFTGKTCHDMSIFMKCLLPSCPEQVTDKNLDIVLPLADEYQTEDLLRKCVEVINQRVESLSEDSIYIPPSRIVTYLRWIEQFSIDDAKACVVKSASYLEGKKLQKEPGYKDIGYELKLEISYARAELLESLFVVTVEEIMEKIQQLKIPVSMHYLPIWRKNITKIIRNEVQLKGAPNHYRAKKTKEQLPVIFASMYICDKLKLPKTYEICLRSLKLLDIKRADFEKGWSSHFADKSYAKERESGKRHALHLCACAD